MNYREQAARVAARGNLFFFASVMLALLAGAFAVTANNKTTLVLALSLCGAFLVLGSVLVFLHSRRASALLALAKAEEAEALAQKEKEEAESLSLLSEDGLPGAFCREIRSYSAPQLRLILDEQKEEYSPEEYAFIQKVLAERG